VFGVKKYVDKCGQGVFFSSALTKDDTTNLRSKGAFDSGSEKFITNFERKKQIHKNLFFNNLNSFYLNQN